MSEEEIEESLKKINKWLKKNNPIADEELGDNEFIAKDLEIERLHSIIKEAREYIEHCIFDYEENSMVGEDFKVVKNILDKVEEE